jgi:hypothetical protein
VQQHVGFARRRVELVKDVLNVLFGPLHVGRGPIRSGLAIQNLPAIGVGDRVRVDERITLLYQSGEADATGSKLLS